MGGKEEEEEEGFGARIEEDGEGVGDFLAESLEGGAIALFGGSSFGQGFADDEDLLFGEGEVDAAGLGHE